jgi:hypothetical protein
MDLEYPDNTKDIVDDQFDNGSSPRESTQNELDSKVEHKKVLEFKDTFKPLTLSSYYSEYTQVNDLETPWNYSITHTVAPDKLWPWLDWISSTKKSPLTPLEYLRKFNTWVLQIKNNTFEFFSDTSKYGPVANQNFHMVRDYCMTLATKPCEVFILNSMMMHEYYKCMICHVLCESSSQHQIRNIRTEGRKKLPEPLIYTVHADCPIYKTIQFVYQSHKFACAPHSAIYIVKKDLIQNSETTKSVDTAQINATDLDEINTRNEELTSSNLQLSNKVAVLESNVKKLEEKNEEYYSQYQKFTDTDVDEDTEDIVDMFLLNNNMEEEKHLSKMMANFLLFTKSLKRPNKDDMALKGKATSSKSTTQILSSSAGKSKSSTHLPTNPAKKPKLDSKTTSSKVPTLKDEGDNDESGNSDEDDEAESGEETEQEDIPVEIRDEPGEEVQSGILMHPSTNKGLYYARRDDRQKPISYKNKHYIIKKSAEFDPFCLNHAFQYVHQKDSYVIKGNTNWRTFNLAFLRIQVADGIVKADVDYTKVIQGGIAAEWNVSDKYYSILINKYAISSKEKRESQSKKKWFPCLDNIEFNLAEKINYDFSQRLSESTITKLQEKAPNIHAKISAGCIKLKDVISLLGDTKSKDELANKSLSIAMKLEFSEYILSLINSDFGKEPLKVPNHLFVPDKTLFERTHSVSLTRIFVAIINATTC